MSLKVSISLVNLLAEEKCSVCFLCVDVD